VRVSGPIYIKCGVEGQRAELFTHVPSDKPTPNKLFIVISSDKGLCGGIHSSVSKATRRALANVADSPLAGVEGTDATVDPNSPIVVVGDKSKAQLLRVVGGNLQMTFNQIGRDIPTFADAAAVADLIIQKNIKYDSVVLVYNKFVSALSYEPTVMEVKGEEALKESST
jgi:F-type H+-transporting ATPase subunit gamma